MENLRTLEVLRSLPDETKRIIITEMITKGIMRNGANLTKEDLEKGLNEFKDRLNDLLVALLKTPFTADYEFQYGVRMGVLIEHLGEDIVVNDEVWGLLFTRPTSHDQATLLALALLSNKDKVIQRVGEASTNAG